MRKGSSPAAGGITSAWRWPSVAPVEHEIIESHPANGTAFASTAQDPSPGINRIELQQTATLADPYR